MRPYEVVLILDSAAAEEDVDNVVTRIKGVLPEGKGKVGQIEKWGRRRFAYEMKHRWDGFYALVELTAEPEVVAELDRMLLLSDDIVRHKVVRVPDAVAGRPRPASISQPAEEAESTGANA